MLAKRDGLLLQRIGVGLDRQGLLLDPPFLVGREDFELAIRILLRLDHVGARIGDLLVQLDALFARGAGLFLYGFQCRYLGLVGPGDLFTLRPDQRGTLVEVVLLRDQSGLLLRLKLFLGVRVGGLEIFDRVLGVVVTAQVELIRLPGRVLVLILDVLDVLGDDVSLDQRVIGVRFTQILDVPLVLLDQLISLLLVGEVGVADGLQLGGSVDPVLLDLNSVTDELCPRLLGFDLKLEVVEILLSCSLFRVSMPIAAARPPRP